MLEAIATFDSVEAPQADHTGRIHSPATGYHTMVLYQTRGKLAIFFVTVYAGDGQPSPPDGQELLTE